MPTTSGPASASGDVVAAGAVVTRRGGEVLLVHRPKYDDWSFPKGKLDPGEHLTACAVREVAEETGLRIRLGVPLPPQRYLVSRGGGEGRMKTVHYWMGRVHGTGDAADDAPDDVSGYRPNAEIDRVAWVPWEEAERRLTYAYDRETLARARLLRRPTRALVVLRHGHAVARKEWRGDDRLRPLAPAGRDEAGRLVPLLEAYGVTRVVSSSSTRCVETVAPYSAATGWVVETLDGLTEEEASVESVVATMDDLLLGGEDSVVCGHRPVLPSMLDALGVEDPSLEKGQMLVVHHRKGKAAAVELQSPADSYR